MNNNGKWVYEIPVSWKNKDSTEDAAYISFWSNDILRMEKKVLIKVKLDESGNKATESSTETHYTLKLRDDDREFKLHEDVYKKLLNFNIKLSDSTNNENSVKSTANEKKPTGKYIVTKPWYTFNTGDIFTVDKSDPSGKIRLVSESGSRSSVAIPGMDLLTEAFRVGIIVAEYK